MVLGVPIGKIFLNRHVVNYIPLGVFRKNGRKTRVLFVSTIFYTNIIILKVTSVYP